nr:MAG TPA: hypothetical protein [Caudoviricetes sp.]
MPKTSLVTKNVTIFARVTSSSCSMTLFILTPSRVNYMR